MWSSSRKMDDRCSQQHQEDPLEGKLAVEQREPTETPAPHVTTAHRQAVEVDLTPLGEAEEDTVELSEPPDLLSEKAKQKLAQLPPYPYRELALRGSPRGPVQLRDGSVYVGEWLQGRRYGQGRLYTRAGGLMEGYWNGLLHIEGREILTNGDSYEGGFREGKMQGYGRYEDFLRRNSYEGEWVQNCQLGRGREDIEDGSTYEGDFENDQRSGYGTIRWASGEVYEGEFRAHVMHGIGRYVWTADKWYEGEWKDGQMHGVGKFANEGKVYEGDFVAGKKHGKGILKWNGNVYFGDFEDNKMHGVGDLTMKGKETKRYAFQYNKRMELVKE